ncbi:GntR family transcriptional regulator [Microvirga sp. BT350]|uniref:GntR family transcriptional regulator n=1 Tax=Microvirga alba TaxID=2791025 RepID=A0A931BTB0_9HYPH|nr:GntR family transcriptional regulator [Microvirga alba]
MAHLASLFKTLFPYQRWLFRIETLRHSRFVTGKVHQECRVKLRRHAIIVYTKYLSWGNFRSIEVVKTSSVPLHLEILRATERHVISGKLKSGHELPDEHKLAERYDFSRMTAKKALSRCSGALCNDRPRAE